MSESTATRPQRDPSASDPAIPESANSALSGTPVLLFELDPWYRVFFRNLGDFLLHRQPPPVEITAQPVPLRPGYFIRTGIDAYRFAESYSGHIAFVIAVYLICYAAAVQPCAQTAVAVSEHQGRVLPSQRVPAAYQHRE